MKAMDSKIPPLIYGMKEVHGLERTVVPKAGSSNITEERHTKSGELKQLTLKDAKKKLNPNGIYFLNLPKETDENKKLDKLCLNTLRIIKNNERYIVCREEDFFNETI